MQLDTRMSARYAAIYQPALFTVTISTSCETEPRQSIGAETPTGHGLISILSTRRFLSVGAYQWRQTTRRNQCRESLSHLSAH